MPSWERFSLHPETQLWQLVGKKWNKLLLCTENHCMSVVTDNKWNTGKNSLHYTPNYSCLHSMQHKNKCWCLITVVQVCKSASDWLYCMTNKNALSNSQPAWQTTTTLFTESENHRMVGVGRDLCGSSSPTLLPKQGHLQQAAQYLVQAGLEYL